MNQPPEPRQPTRLSEGEVSSGDVRPPDSSVSPWAGPPVVLQQLNSSGWLSEVLWRDEVDSTNTLAKLLVQEGRLNTPALLVAKRQIAGRGRLGRRWHSDTGTLTFSVVLSSHDLQPPSERWPQLALVAGLAVTDVIRELDNEVSLSLKWPNDVYINDGKVAGVLIETAGDDDHVIIGIGVNVSTDIENGPSDLLAKAASIYGPATEQSLSTFLILPGIIDRLHQRVNRWNMQCESMVDDFREVCHLRGRRVSLRLGDETVEGICDSIDEQGHLQIETSAGMRVFASGEVIHWSSLPPAEA